MKWPPQECKSWDGTEYWIKINDEYVEIKQMTGGTRGTDYIYVEDSQGLLLI